MKNNHQICVILKGLYAASDGKNYNDEFFFSRRPGYSFEYDKKLGLPVKKGGSIPIFDDDSYACFRINKEDADSAIHVLSEIKLPLFLSFYSLITGHFVQKPNGWSMYPIDETKPFGTFNPSVFTGGPVLNPEQIEDYSKKLDKSVELFTKHNSIFDLKRKRHLKNALIYYYKASEDFSKSSHEEALIDLVIALESLLSESPGDIRYKVSLRAAMFLSLINGNINDYYNIIYEMYGVRNNIVHGTYVEKVDEKKVNTLNRFIGMLILNYLNIELEKNEIIPLLDLCIRGDKKSIEKLTQKNK